MGPQVTNIFASFIMCQMIQNSYSAWAVFQTFGAKTRTAVSVVSAIRVI